MKIKREQLKAIIKECLVELLQEGLGGFGSVARNVSEHRVRDRSLEPLPNESMRAYSQTDPAAVRRRTMDLTTTGHSSTVYEANRERQKAVTEVVKNVSSNPMMSAIFADTANTTLRMQDSPTSSLPGDIAAKTVAASDPISMFSEKQIDIWNKAAFAPDKPGLIK